MKRDNRLEVLRVISALLVIVVHIANYYTRRTASLSAFSYLGAITANAAARVSVPVFFMISGAPLLAKPYDRAKNRARIIKRGVCLAAITGVYLLWDKYFMGKRVSLKGLLNSPERALLWFMYALLGLYIALPFIKGMTDSMGEREDLLFVCLWFLFTEMKRHGIMRAYPVPIISGTYYLGYFVLGHILLKYKDRFDYSKKAPLAASLALISTGTAVAISYSKYLTNGKHYTGLLTYSNIFSMVSAVAFFIAVYGFSKDGENKTVKKLSDLSFGIYLVHGMILDAVMKIIPYRRINSFLGIPLIFAIVFPLAALFTAGLKKVKFIKDYI